MWVCSNHVCVCVWSCAYVGSRGAEEWGHQHLDSGVCARVCVRGRERMRTCYFLSGPHGRRVVGSCCSPQQ